MPGGDGTGPAGMGSMSGRAAGFCAGYSVPGYANPVGGRGNGFGFGRGGGWGRGGGRGFRNRYYATGLTGWQRATTYPAPGYAPEMPLYGQPAAATREQETEMLRGQSEYLQQQLSAVQKRLEEVEAEKKK